MSAIISAVGGLFVGAGAAGAFAAGAAAIGLAGMGASTVYGAVQSNQANQAQKGAMGQQQRAQDQATRDAQAQQRRSEMAQNAANRRQPDVSSIMQRAGGTQGGASGTMLTGPTGVDPNALALGKSTLLGS